MKIKDIIYAFELDNDNIDGLIGLKDEYSLKNFCYVIEVCKPQNFSFFMKKENLPYYITFKNVKWRSIDNQPY